MTYKYFTVKEANKALILVKMIVNDIVQKRMKMNVEKDTVRDIEKKRNEIKLIDENSNELDVLEKDIKKKLFEVKYLSKEITYHLGELEQVGCYLKDFDKGQIDFPFQHEGRVVFLCWSLGEEKISSWRELTQSFETRKPVAYK